MMEILDWILLVVVLLLLFYAKFNYPTQYHAVMDVIEGAVRPVMSFIQVNVLKQQPVGVNETIQGGGG